jgi:hypothetical protein
MQINHLLYDLIHDICENKAKKMKMSGVFLDLSKAFDCLDHDIYLGIIRKLGFDRTVQAWFHNYLCNRKQYVNIGKVNSSLLPINIGTPQGTVLGPLIFLIYVHSLQNVIKKEMNFSYADDTTLLFSARTNGDLRDTINENLPKVLNWFKDHKLTVNAGKTRILHFDSDPGDIKIDNTKVEVVSEFKLLGIWLDNKLSWKKQANYTISKIKPVIYHLKKLKHILDINNKRLIYNGLIHSRLCYGLPIWMGVSNGLQTRIQTLQNKAIRAIYNMNYTDSVKQVMEDQNYLNFTQTATYMTMLLVRSIVYNPKLSHLIPTSEGRLRHNTNQNVITPFYKTSLLQQQPSYLCPRIWNIFPLDIRELKLHAFKQNIKKVLLQANPQLSPD